MEIERIQKRASTLDIVARIIQVLMIAIILIIVIGAMTVLFSRGKPVFFSYGTMTSGFLQFEISDEALSEIPLRKASVFMWMLSTIVAPSILLYAASVSHAILNKLKEGSPFDPSIPKLIKRVGVLIFLGSIADEIINIISYMALKPSIGSLNSIFKGGVVEEVNINHVFNILSLIVMLICFMLASIFEYGIEIQRKVDLTGNNESRE